MNGKLTIIKVDGTQTEKKIHEAPSLATLQEAVGGYIEVVPGLTKLYVTSGEKPEFINCVAFCNEEGKNLGLPINATATLTWYNCLGHTTNDYLCGSVVFVTGDDGLLNSL